MTAVPDKRQSLLQAAAKLLAAKGLKQTTIQDITREAGVAVGTFYLYFNTKDELIHHLIGELPRQVRSRLDAVIASTGTGAGFFTLLGLCIHTVLNTITGLQDLARLYLTTSVMYPQLHTEIAANAAYFSNLMAQLIRRGIATGEIRPVNPEVAAWALVGMVKESAEHCLFSPNPTPPAVLARELQSLVENGLRPPRNAGEAKP